MPREQEKEKEKKKGTDLFFWLLFKNKSVPFYFPFSLSTGATQPCFPLVGKWDVPIEFLSLSNPAPG